MRRTVKRQQVRGERSVYTVGTTRLSSAGLVAALVSLGPTLARADEPQPAPAPYEATEPGGARVTATIDPPLITILPAEGDGVGMWFIDGWRRNVLVAEDGASALALPDGSGLLPFADAGQVLLTFHRPSGAGSDVTLGEVLDPAALPLTASHVRWLREARVEPGAFVLDTEGGTIRVDARTGAVLESPRGPVPQRDERIAGVAGLADLGCLPYEALRQGLTALGPAEPLPALPPPFAWGCTVGHVDERIDVVTVLEEGVQPRPPVAGSGFYAAQDPLWGVVPLGEAPEGARAVTVTVSRSVAGSAEFILAEAWDAPALYEYGGGQFRTVGLDGLDPAQTEAALGALAGLWATGPRDFDQARQRNDLGALPDGRHHLAVVPGGAGTYQMLFDKQGAHITGVDYFRESGYFGCFDATLDGGGVSGTGDSAFTDEGTEVPWAVSRGVAFDYGAVGTLRPLPPLMRAEIEAEGWIGPSREACLAALGVAATSVTPEPVAPLPIAEGGAREFVVHVNEPFLSFETAGEVAIVTSPEDPAGTPVPIRRLDEGGIAQVTGVYGGQPFALTISAQACRDDMAGLPYSHRVIMTWGVTTKDGCARLATEPQPREGE